MFAFCITRYLALSRIQRMLGRAQWLSVLSVLAPSPLNPSCPLHCPGSLDTYINYLGSYSITQLSKMDSSQPLSTCHLLLNVTNKYVNLTQYDVLSFIML